MAGGGDGQRTEQSVVGKGGVSSNCLVFKIMMCVVLSIQCLILVLGVYLKE